MAGRIEKHNSPVANNAKRIMESKCMTQAKVAAKAGYSVQAFNDMLNGRKVMKAVDIQAIANALEVDANRLFGSSNKKGA